MAAVLLYVCSAFVVWVCSDAPSVFADNLRCPSSCTCLGNNVDCSSFGLINIPKDIPVWVTRLELQSNGIREVRPDDLIGLHKLEYLDLSNNGINTINGSVFRDLLALRTLKLDSNKLTEIPLFPRSLNIMELTMSHNHVVTIPIKTMVQMPELLTMDLSNNYILSITNGSFPAGSKLTNLVLNSNQISVIEQGSMSNLTFLETLKMNKNKVNELPQGMFGQLNSLKFLELMRNKIKIIKGLTFQGLSKLQLLKLKRNNIVVLKDGAFWGLPSLNILQMDHNKIVNVTKAWLFGLNMLKSLSLSHNKIAAIESDAWEPCKHLEKLDLTHNKLTAITEATLTHLNSLDTLLLDHNHISRIDDGAFHDLEDLSTLELNSNQIPWTMEDVSGAFQGLSGLTTLGLRANSIRSIAVHAFVGLSSLRILHLEDNEITLIQENAFEALTELEDLRFNSSKLFCDCHLLWLPAWLKKSGFQQSALGTCFHPPALRGVAVTQVDLADFKCNNAEFPKPVILDGPRSANGFKGENMSLSCIAALTGDSQPRINWKKDNVLMDEALSVVTTSSDGDVKRYTSTLHLTDIQDSMAGRYQCVISNDFGSAFSHWAHVNVYVYPVFLKTPKDVTVKAGKPAELKCAATGQPPPVISWQKDGGDNFPAARERRMQVYPNDDRFYIMNTRPADEGVYSCMARNEAGVVITNATVTVLETPDFVQPMQGKKISKKGETTVLQCMASGSPQPKLTWLKDDKELVKTPRHFFTVDNQILVIVDTQWSDAGLYACRMSNSLGTAKGTTELQVVSSSGEASEASGAFGLDDESTTTGIIIIAVVCCVVGTSLVWVIIIYHTRKRHEVYSATPTDETTLPGEVPSSGYMSSEKEGSYSQGPITINGGYHYQDYQLKESGYDSLSGQFRVSCYPHQTMCPADVDEDDKPTAMTAGDRLLRQIRGANSVSSIPYPASDGDTIGSRHSTSSGRRSGSSDPPSSHSGQPGHSLSRYHLSVAGSSEEEHRRNPLSSSSHSLASDDPSQTLCDSQLFTSPRKITPRTFHASKPVSYSTPKAASHAESVGESCDRCCESHQNNHWHCSGGGGGCDSYAAVSSSSSCPTTKDPHPLPPPPCKSCLSENSVMPDRAPRKGRSCVHTEIHKINSECPSCCSHGEACRSPRTALSHGVSPDNASLNSGHVHSDNNNKLLHNPVSLPSSSSLSSSSSSLSSCHHSNGKHASVTQLKGGGSGNNKQFIRHCGQDVSDSDMHFCTHHVGLHQHECGEGCVATNPSLLGGGVPDARSSSSHASEGCHCEVVTDMRHSCCDDCQKSWGEKELGDSGLMCYVCSCQQSGNSNSSHHQSDHSQQQKRPSYLCGHCRVSSLEARLRSCSSVDHDPSCCGYCELCFTPVHTVYGSCGCDIEDRSKMSQSACLCASLSNCQNHPSPSEETQSAEKPPSPPDSILSRDPDRSLSISIVRSSTIPVNPPLPPHNPAVIHIDQTAHL